MGGRPRPDPESEKSTALACPGFGAIGPDALVGRPRASAPAAALWRGHESRVPISPRSPGEPFWGSPAQPSFRRPVRRVAGPVFGRGLWEEGLGGWESFVRSGALATSRVVLFPWLFGGPSVERFGDDLSGLIAHVCRNLGLRIERHRRFGDPLALVHAHASHQSLERRDGGT